MDLQKNGLTKKILKKLQIAKKQNDKFQFKKGCDCMKKIITFLLIWACVFCVAGCSSTSLSGIENATEVKVIQYDKYHGTEKGMVVLTEENEIKQIVDNLNSLEYKKMITIGPTMLEYKLLFFDSNSEVIKIVFIPVEEWVSFDGYFHSIKSGELDRAYIAGLFEQPGCKSFKIKRNITTSPQTDG